MSEMNQNEAGKMPENTHSALPGKLYIEAYACGDGDGPDWAIIDDPKALLEQVLKLQSVVHAHGLSEARTWNAPDTWGPGDVEDDLRLTGDELVVTSDSFWFTCHPKHADHNCETSSIAIVDFSAKIALAQEGEVLYMGSDVEYLKERIEEEFDDFDDDEVDASPSPSM